jgi:hypothetical protein
VNSRRRVNSDVGRNISLRSKAMSKKTPVPSTLEEMQHLTNQLMEGDAQLLQELQTTMTRDMDRIIEYFWNRRKQELRRRLPQSVIWFFETDEWNETLSDMRRAQVDVVTYQLEMKKYIVRKTDKDGTFFELAPAGVVYLKDKHPTVLAYWKRLLELSPPTLTLLVAIVGFVASVFGIIQFVAWLKGK